VSGTPRRWELQEDRGIGREREQTEKLELATSSQLTKGATVLAHTWSLKVTS
jgi:hypothetical protein